MTEVIADVADPDYDARLWVEIREGKAKAVRVHLRAQVERIAGAVSGRVKQTRVPLSRSDLDAVDRQGTDWRVVGLNGIELVLIDRDLERRVRAFVDETKANALVRRETQLGQVRLRELVAGLARCRETAIVQATTVDDV